MAVHAKNKKKKRSSTKKTPKIKTKMSPTISNTVNGPCNHKDVYLWHRGSIIEQKKRVENTNKWQFQRYWVIWQLPGWRSSSQRRSDLFSPTVRSLLYRGNCSSSGMAHCPDYCRIRLCISHPPGAVFQAGLLDDQEGANPEWHVFVFGQLSARCFPTPTCSAPTLSQLLWRYGAGKIDPASYGIHRRSIRYVPWYRAPFSKRYTGKH